jgi:hypothetical protein
VLLKTIEVQQKRAPANASVSRCGASHHVDEASADPARLDARFLSSKHAAMARVLFEWVLKLRYSLTQLLLLLAMLLLLLLLMLT